MPLGSSKIKAYEFRKAAGWSDNGYLLIIILAKTKRTARKILNETLAADP
jgi:hypothetical protein